MRAGTSFVSMLILLAALIGCEQPTATSQRIPGPPQDGVTVETPAAAPGEAAPVQTPVTPPAGYAPYAQPEQNAASQPAASPPQPGGLPGGLGNIPGVAPGSYSPAAAPSDNAASAPIGQPAQSPVEQPIREKAEAGVGVRGDKIQSGGIYTTPAKAYFQVRERLTFLQVDQALQLYRGLEGRLPQSHEEFMAKVIQANQIQLPELPQGSSYQWDPQKGELMVERPR